MEGDRTVEMKGLSVMIGIPTTRGLEPETVQAIVGSMARCSKLGVDSQLAFVKGCGVVQWARDEVVDQFLSSKANRLFWIDSDMEWTPDNFVRILALTQLVPVVGATYAAKIEGPTTFYVGFDKDVGMVSDEFGLFDVTGMGLGFTCMRREVIEAVVAKSPMVCNQVNRRSLHSVFRVDTDGKGNRRGEDIAFFADIREAGFPVKLDPETSLGHIGLKTYRGSIKDAVIKT